MESGTMQAYLVAGQAAAAIHFAKLQSAMREFLPAEMHHDSIPPAISDLAGVFTASSKRVYTQVFTDSPGFSPMTITFCYNKQSQAWEFQKFIIAIGSEYFTSRQFSAYSLPDAVVMSKRVHDMLEDNKIVIASARAKAESAEDGEALADLKTFLN